jgi:hypothetical protein
LANANALPLLRLHAHAPADDGLLRACGIHDRALTSIPWSMCATHEIGPFDRSRALTQQHIVTRQDD